MTAERTAGHVSAPTRSVGDVLDGMHLTRAQVLVGSILFVTFVVEAWEQVGLIYVAGAFAEEYGVSDAQVGLALSAVTFGMIPGALAWGPAIDRWGRKPVVVWSMLAYAVIALVAAVAPSFEVFVAARILSGVAFAGVYSATFPYFMELLPTRSRGRGTVALSIGFPIGTLLCIGVSQSLGPISWRLVAGAGALVALWALVVARWVPESPYWLARKGRHDQAAAVLRRLGAVGAVAPFRLEAESEPGRLRGLFRAPVRKVFLLLLVVSFTFSWGYWGLQVWLPTLLQGRGLTLDASLAFVAISQVISIPGYLLAAWLTGRLGRKKVFIAFTVAAAIGGIAFGLATDAAQLYVANIVLAFFFLGAWGIWNTWAAEMLPTAHRGIGYSWATSAILLASTVAVPTIGLMLDAGLGQALILGSLVIALVISLAAVLPLPETEGRALS